MQISSTSDNAGSASAWILKPLFDVFGHFLLRKDQLSLLMQLPLLVIFAYGSKHRTLWMILTLLITILLFSSLGTVSKIATISQLGETNASVLVLQYNLLTIPLTLFIDNAILPFQNTDYQQVRNYSDVAMLIDKHLMILPLKMIEIN